MLRAYACGGVYFLETWKKRGIIHEAKGMQAVTVTEGGRSATSSFQKPPYATIHSVVLSTGAFSSPASYMADCGALETNELDRSLVSAFNAWKSESFFNAWNVGTSRAWRALFLRYGPGIGLS